MEKIQIVLDKKLLLATDRAARRAKRNRQGYLARPEARNESNDWEAGAQAYGKQKAKIQAHAKVGRIPLSP